MEDDTLWEDENPVTRFDIDVPQWIEQDISPNTLMAIEQGGCASGAYMPAVTYYDAKKTMGEHGDDVLQYIQDTYGELPKPQNDESWAGMAVHYMSVGVELWAGVTLQELRDLNPEPSEPV